MRRHLPGSEFTITLSILWCGLRMTRLCSIRIRWLECSPQGRPSHLCSVRVAQLHKATMFTVEFSSGKIMFNNVASAVDHIPIYVNVTHCLASHTSRAFALGVYYTWHIVNYQYSIVTHHVIVTYCLRPVEHLCVNTSRQVSGEYWCTNCGVSFPYADALFSRPASLL